MVGFNSIVSDDGYDFEVFVLSNLPFMVCLVVFTIHFLTLISVCYFEAKNCGLTFLKKLDQSPIGASASLA